MKLNIQLFASTTISAKMSGDSRYTQKLIVEEVNPDPQNNTSDVNYTLILETTVSYQYGSYNYNGNDTYSISINDSVVASGGFTYDFRNYHSLTIKTGTVTGIPHNSDGTKTINISSYVGMTHVSKGSGTATGTLVLTDLHKPPSNISYTITETNSVLTSASLPNNTFVENLSIKSIAITGILHDNATIDRVGVYNRITPYPNTTSPLTLDLRTTTLQKNDAGTKIPLVAYIKDSFNTQGLSSALDNPDLYDFITYNAISITETQTFAKRYGQLSGQVKLTISGSYFNGTIGNKNQGSSYKPTIKYKFWRLGTTEPGTYANTISASNIGVSNGIFTVSGLNIGSTDTSASNYFNPSYSYRLKIQVNDNFTTYPSSEKVITKGEPVWSEYKDRLKMKKAEISTDIVNPNLDLFNDTSGSDWKTMMKNKLDYCVSNMKTSKTNMETFANGGWYGVEYGLGIFSKIGTTYQLVWNSPAGIFYVRKSGNNYYYYSNSPITLYNNDTGIQSKSYASVSGLSNYKKLAITFTLYKNNDQANTGGTAHICWLDLTKKDANGYARSGIVVPYSSQHLSSGNAQANDFKALFEADVNNNRVYCLFVYSGSVQTSSNYVMTKIEGYYN